MLVYKIDIIDALAKVGINTTAARDTKVFSQSTMRKFKTQDTSITLDNIDRLCGILNLQPGDLIEFKYSGSYTNDELHEYVVIN